jgi:nitrogen fixation NifU-like protein
LDIYRENILDHFNNPRNFGKIDNPDASYEKDNPFCGDRIRIGFTIHDSRFTIQKIKFSGEGCAISIASASMLTEKAKGAKVKDLRKLDKSDILKMLGIGLSPTRLKCALLPLEVLQKAIANLEVGSAR